MLWVLIWIAMQNQGNSNEYQQQGSDKTQYRNIRYQIWHFWFDPDWHLINLCGDDSTDHHWDFILQTAKETVFLIRSHLPLIIYNSSSFVFVVLKGKFSTK